MAAQARWPSEIPSKLMLFCSLGTQSSILKTWLEDTGPKDGTCKSRFWVLPGSSFEQEGHEGRLRLEATPGNWDQGGEVYPLDLPEVIQPIGPAAQHILALCQLGHQVFEVVLGFCKGPLVGEVGGGTIGVPSPWVQRAILHRLPLTLEEKEKRIFIPRSPASAVHLGREGDYHLHNLRYYVPGTSTISWDPCDSPVRETLLFPFYGRRN